LVHVPSRQATGTRAGAAGSLVVIPLPRDDEHPHERDSTPFVTFGLIGVNVLVFLIELYGGSGSNSDLVHQFAVTPGVLPAQLVEQGLIPTALAFVTYSFLHAGWLHIAGNMLFLWVFGANVEDAVGHAGFVVFYLVCALAGSAAYALTAPTSMAPLVGASGAIAGVVAAYLMLRPCARIKVFAFVIPVALAAYWVIGSWIVVQAIDVLAHVDDGIAWWTHLGGLLAGGLLILVMRRPGIRLFDCAEESVSDV
jgi:membrane associated rhomboid family serine protease